LRYGHAAHDRDHPHLPQGTATGRATHGTAGDAQPSLNWLTNPASTASVHYLVDRQGTVYQLVNEANAAWGNGIPEQGSVFLRGHDRG
jgi:N-acetyl-anhydromuramyl-L-alanine amidase AmpD